MVLRKVAGGYKNPSKIHTNAPKRLKHGLKWSWENTLDDLRCPQTIFFFEIGCGGPQFFVIGQKWFFGRCEIGILSPLQTNFENKLSEDIMDHQEYLLGIILSHIWVFLEHLYGFWKDFYTRPPLSEYHFWPINKYWGPLHPNFEKKLSEDIMYHQEYLLEIILSHNWALLDH